MANHSFEEIDYKTSYSSVILHLEKYSSIEFFIKQKVIHSLLAKILIEIKNFFPILY